MGDRPLADPAASPAEHLMKALSQKDKMESKFFCGLRNAVNGHSRELNTEELKVVEATWDVLSDAVLWGSSGGIAGLRPPSPSAASVESTWGISSDAVESAEQEAAASGSTTGLRLQSLHAAEGADDGRNFCSPPWDRSVAETIPPFQICSMFVLTTCVSSAMACKTSFGHGLIEEKPALPQGRRGFATPQRQARPTMGPRLHPNPDAPLQSSRKAAADSRLPKGKPALPWACDCTPIQPAPRNLRLRYKQSVAIRAGGDVECAEAPAPGLPLPPGSPPAPQTGPHSSRIALVVDVGVLLGLAGRLRVLIDDRSAWG